MQECRNANAEIQECRNAGMQKYIDADAEREAVCQEAVN
jgi:hypothetical protein